MPLYHKPVRQLMRDMAMDMQLQPGQIISRDQVLDWFRSHYPLVKEGTVSAHLTKLSTNARSRLHYGVRSDGTDDLFYQVDSSRFRLYEAGKDPLPITTSNPVDPPPDSPDRITPPSDPSEGSQFAYEHDLRDYLARNLRLIESGLRLYTDEDITGVEFPAGGRFIDILAVDAEGGYVVIELKVSKGYDRVVGQLLRYMGWIQAHHAEAGQRVRGVIVAKDITEDLKLACARIPDVRLFEYALSVTLTSIQ